MNVKVVRRDGNLCVVLPQDVARDLGAEEGQDLELSKDGDAFRLSRAAPRDEVMAAHRKSMDRFASLYEKLAK